MQYNNDAIAQIYGNICVDNVLFPAQASAEEYVNLFDKQAGYYRIMGEIEEKCGKFFAASSDLTLNEHAAACELSGFITGFRAALAAMAAAPDDIRLTS